MSVLEGERERERELDRKSVGDGSSLVVEEDEGSHLPICQTTLVILLH